MDFDKEMLDLLSEEEYVDGFENYRKSIVTTIAYLIGVAEDKLENEGIFDLDEYEKLKNHENATIIRHLCILRTQFLRNYKSISDARKFDFKPIELLTDYLNVESIRYLRRKDIEIATVSTNPSPTVNIAYINQYIQDNIDKVKDIIPEWIKFQYVRAMFLMSGGYAGHNGLNLRNNFAKVNTAIYEAGKNFSSQRTMYPFQMYITWPYRFRETDGNILFNDLKFLKLLYAANKDHFTASRYVVDAKADTKEGIYDFVKEAMNVAVFVDCENVDPYAFAATILNLDADNIAKIKKIKLYDDVNTSSAWDYISNIIHIPVEHIEIERLLENKSLVDITMAGGVYQEYYENDVESVILVSSDSDFWAVINQMKKARFLVLNEYRKTSSTIIETLDKYGIEHCYMSDFAQDNRVQGFKSDVLYLGLLDRVENFNETGEFIPMDVNELLQDLFYEANISAEEGQLKKEKDAFYNKYLKNGLLIKPVEANGSLRFKIELSKK